LLADYADALAMAQGRTLQGEPEKIILRALAIDPDNVKALLLAGTAAFNRSDPRAAIRHWERVLGLLPKESDMIQRVQASIAQARSLAGSPGGKAQVAKPAPAQGGNRVSGVVRLAPELAGKVAPGDTVFIFARAAEGPRMPLAVLRKRGSDLPAEFALDDSMAMAPQMRLSAFPRVLRGAGLPIGPDRVLDAVRALEVAGVERREDFYWTLASVFLGRREQFEIYDQAFHIFWRDPQLLERVMAMFLPQVYGRQGRNEEPSASNRVADALYPKPKKPQEPPPEPPHETELDATFSFSSREVLQHADFETMTSEEIAQAKKMLANLRLPIPEIRTRRFRSDPRGARVDL